MNIKHWQSIKTAKPAEGVPVVVLYTDNTLPVNAWLSDIAYYCDGGFYQLKLDKNLGVLRKCYVEKRIDYWSDYMVFDTTEIKLY